MSELVPEPRPKPAVPMKPVSINSNLLGYIGIDTIIEQMRRKTMKTGFDFNIMVVGTEGHGGAGGRGGGRPRGSHFFPWDRPRPWLPWDELSPGGRISPCCSQKPDPLLPSRLADPGAGASGGLSAWPCHERVDTGSLLGMLSLFSGVRRGAVVLSFPTGVRQGGPTLFF